MRSKYSIESRPGKIWNAATGRLNRVYVVVYNRNRPDLEDAKTLNATTPWLVPGMWTKKTARHIAKTCNDALRKQR